MGLMEEGLDAVRRLLDGGEREDSVERVPRPRYDDWRPTVTYTADVTKAGQVNVPATEREQRLGSDIEPGDHYHVHCFPPSRQDERVAANRYVAFDATVTADHYLTIPRALRVKHDIRHGDTVAIHLYWSSENFDGA